MASKGWRALPASVWVLGLGSLFMDASSELIHSLLPVFLAASLGASMVTIGVIEGVAEATAAVLKVVSGVLSDRLGRRKRLVLSGYALAAITKPVFPLATSVGWVFAARFVDRIGKGIRGAPRDALIADVTPPELRGAAYGLRQALDSVGAVLGPLAALGAMLWLAGDVRAVLWLATVPAAVAVALLALYVREPERDGAPAKPAPLGLGDVRRLPPRFWLTVALGAVLTLARFSEAFLVLRARDVGLALAWTPLVLVVMNAFYAGTAYPAGAAADRMSRRRLLLVGTGLLVLADVALALAASPALVFAGTALWGLHMALTQGLFSKLVADAAPPDLRGSGFGIFHLVTGGAVLLASVIAGSLWSALGPHSTFIVGAGFASVASLGLLIAGKETVRGG